MKFKRKLINSLKGMSWEQHILYWIFPLVASSILTVLYFFGSPALQNFVAHPQNRELGFLEMLENILLVSIIMLNIQVIRKVKEKHLKALFLFSLFATTILFLEEIDYGNHYFHFLGDRSAGKMPVNFNIHNKDEVIGNVLMKISYVLLGFFFVILPYYNSENLPAWIRPLIPSLHIQFTVFVLPFIGRLPWILYDWNYNTNHSLNGNLAEFEEFGIYYIFFVYFLEMKKKHSGKYPVARSVPRNSAGQAKK